VQPDGKGVVIVDKSWQL